MAKSIYRPMTTVLLQYGVLGPGALIILKLLYDSEYLACKCLLNGTEIETALKMVFLASLPMILMVHGVFLYRGLTVFAETTTSTEETLYLKVSKMVLTNTTEQTLIFVLNLLSAGALHSVAKEKLVVLTFIFLIARGLFWLGYIYGAYINKTVLRAPGFALTLLNNMLLLYFNITALLKL